MGGGSTFSDFQFAFDLGYSLLQCKSKEFLELYKTIRTKNIGTIARTAFKLSGIDSVKGEEVNRI